jgi:hypothetical protein
VTPEQGNMLMTLGLVLLLPGAVLCFANRLPFLGHLAGDLCILRSSFTFCFPIGTGILLSLLHSFVWWLLRK